MKFCTDYVMRQIKIPRETYLKIKSYCFDRKISLVCFYEIMLDWFLNKYQHNNSLIYHASTKQGCVLSLWINPVQISQISQMARKANVSDARVIYTAMMLYQENIPQLA